MYSQIYNHRYLLQKLGWGMHGMHGNDIHNMHDIQGMHGIYSMHVKCTEYMVCVACVVSVKCQCQSIGYSNLVICDYKCENNYKITFVMLKC